MHLSPIVGVADTSPEGGSKKYVILSVSEISHVLSEKVQTLRKFTLPGVCRGRYAPSQRQIKKCVILSNSEISHRTIDKRNDK